MAYSIYLLENKLLCLNVKSSKLIVQALSRFKFISEIISYCELTTIILSLNVIPLKFS